MTETTHDYDQYFSLRTVDENFYRNYVIPKHILAELPVSKEAAILDIGCGYGQFLNRLKEMGYQNLTGIDISEEALKSCQKRGIAAFRTESIGGYCQQAGRRFDFIMMSHVLEHIQKEEVVETLRLIRTQLLSEKGYIYIMVPNAQSNTGAYWMYEDFTHYTLFTAGSLDYVLKAAGYQQIVFLNADGTQHMMFWKRGIIKTLLKIYRWRQDFWNSVTRSSLHKPSPRIYTFELKVKAR